MRVIEIMNALLELGIELSLDDFGTGSSSLAYLRELPVQELKIDKSFILGMDEDEEAATIVRTVVDLAHNLGLRAVAEGIETEEAYRLLAESGCDYGQGFLMGRPMPAAELSELARRRARRRVSRLASSPSGTRRRRSGGPRGRRCRLRAAPGADSLADSFVAPPASSLLGQRGELAVGRDEVGALQAAEHDHDHERAR